MMTQHLEKQLEESRNEVESLQQRLEILVEERERMTREKAALLNAAARKVMSLV